MNNTVLAEDPTRLARQAAIHRASAKARRDMAVLDAEARRELKLIYKATVNRLTRDIEAFAGSDGNVQLEVLQRLIAQANNGLAQLEESRDGALSNGLNAGASAGVQPFVAESAVLSVSLTNLAEDAVRAARSFIADDGLQLSDRIWRNDRHARRVVQEAIEQAVIQGHSASQAAREFLARGESVPGDVLNKLNAAQANKIVSDIKRGLMNASGSPMDNAMRLFRTEINRAHGLAYQNTAFSHPDVVGTRFLLSPSHPRPDICDMHARVNRHGLGPGVYPQGKSPWPAHPNTLSYEETVFIDQITTEDRENKETRIDWLKKQPPHIQELVLASRNKRAALQAGVMVEGQIKTPWKVLKKRYELKGIDVDRLLTAKPLNVAKDFKGQGVNYVYEQGLLTGFEHASAVDLSKGIEFFRTTSKKTNSVSFDMNQLSYLINPKNNIDLIHNHPGSRSLSLPDLKVATYQGVSNIVAVGHDGAIYTAKVRGTLPALEKTYQQVDDIVYSEIVPLIRSKTISVEDANAFHAHIVNASLSELGVIDYQWEKSKTLNAALKKIDADDIIGRVIDEVKL